MPQAVRKIDIAMPIGHWSPLLKASLASIKLQPDVYSLAIMDASIDPRVRADIETSGLVPEYWREAKDDGQAAAIAEGWRNLNGAIVSWLNADDMLVAGVLGSVVEQFNQDTDLDVLHGQSTISEESGIYLGLHSEARPVDDFLLRSNFISQPSCFVRRSALENIGGLNETLHYTMDWDLWIRLYRDGRKFTFTDEILSNVTWASGTKTASLPWLRLHEIYNLLRQSYSPYVAAKGIFGVLQHHVLFYSGDKKSLETPISKMGCLPIINLTSKQQQQLIVRLANVVSSISCSCENAHVTSMNGTYKINFKSPIMPCAAVQVKFKEKTAGHAVFETATWGNL